MKKVDKEELQRPKSAINFLIFEFGHEVRIPFEKACQILGMAKQTGYNRKSDGTFPVPVYKEGIALYVDIRDLSDYLDKDYLNKAADYVPKDWYLLHANDWFRSNQ